MNLSQGIPKTKMTDSSCSFHQGCNDSDSPAQIWIIRRKQTHALGKLSKPHQVCLLNLGSCACGTKIEMGPKWHPAAWNSRQPPAVPGLLISEPHPCSLVHFRDGRGNQTFQIVLKARNHSVHIHFFTSQVGPQKVQAFFVYHRSSQKAGTNWH